jgi:hypothetical protein
MGRMRVTIDHGGGESGLGVIVAIVAIVLLAGSADTLARAAGALITLALVLVGSLVAGAVCIAVVILLLRRRSVRSLSPRTLTAQVVTAVPEARTAPRALAGSQSLALAGSQSRALPGLSALVNPHNGHAYVCPCVPCALFWDTAPGMVAYLETTGQAVPDRLYRAILPASEPGNR